MVRPGDRSAGAGRGVGQTAGVLLLLSTADTDLLAARAVPEPALPAAAGEPGPRVAAVDLDGVSLVVVRLLGGRRAWEGLDGLLADAARRRRAGGRARRRGRSTPELTALSTVPAGVVADAAAYLREGGPDNLRELVAFLSDTVLLTGHGFAAAGSRCRRTGVHGSRAAHPGRPTVGVVFYRAHELSGNTAFVDVLCDAVEAAGGNALPVFVPSLRPGADGRVAAVDELLLGQVDALVVTVLAGGGSNAADAEGWDARALAALDVPVLQGLCVTSSRGRLGGLRRRAGPDRRRDAGGDPGVRRPARSACRSRSRRPGRTASRSTSPTPSGPPGSPASPSRTPGCGTSPNADKRLALVLSSYPTKHSRVGNAVGLDTPASAVVLLPRCARRATTSASSPRTATSWSTP